MPEQHRFGSGRRRNRMAAIGVRVSAAAVLLMLLWIVSDIVGSGWSQLSTQYLVDPPRDSGRAGGIGPILVSTGLILMVSLGAAVPVSLATAIALAESTATPLLARGIRRSLDVLAAVPSIVFGLFGNAVFCIGLQMGYSILSGGLTLACMILPILIRTTEQAIRAVPFEYRLAAAGLGLSRSAMLARVILPAAVPAMAGGLILSIGRVLAETAALIFTAGYVTRMPGSIMDSGRSLSVHIYDLAMNIPGGTRSACSTATVLVVCLLMINLAAVRLLNRRQPAPGIRLGGTP